MRKETVNLIQWLNSCVSESDNVTQGGELLATHRCSQTRGYHVISCMGDFPHSNAPPRHQTPSPHPHYSLQSSSTSQRPAVASWGVRSPSQRRQAMFQPTRGEEGISARGLPVGSPPGRAQEMRRGQGQRRVAATSAGPTDAAGCSPEGHAPLLLGDVTGDVVIHYS